MRFYVQWPLNNVIIVIVKAVAVDIRQTFSGIALLTMKMRLWSGQTGKRTEKRVALQQITGDVSLLLDYIDEQWVDFLPHHYYMKMQQAYIANTKKVRIFPLLKHIEMYLLSFFFLRADIESE